MRSSDSPSSRRSRRTCIPRTNPSSATASPAASSPRNLLTPGGLCAIHQPNSLPRLTTPAKSFAADYCIVLDDVQFVRRDCRHRCRPATLGGPGQQRWLSIPTCSRFTTDRDSTRVLRRGVRAIR
ncbi:WbqC family protein [Streptomyces celluloflavus]